MEIIRITHPIKDPNNAEGGKILAKGFLKQGSHEIVVKEGGKVTRFTVKKLREMRSLASKGSFNIASFSTVLRTADEIIISPDPTLN